MSSGKRGKHIVVSARVKREVQGPDAAAVFLDPSNELMLIVS